MTQQDVSDAQIDRARIDGGFSFAIAAFILGFGLLAVLERIGLPDEMLRSGVIALIFSGLAIVALLLRTMRPVDFYAGGRRLPGAYAGVAFAGMVLGLFLPFLPPGQQGISFASVATGFCIGVLWALFATGPALRRSGAYSITDLIVSRFPTILIRGPVVLIIGFCAACVALGGYEIALHSFVAATGLDRRLGCAILGGLIILLIVPAGLSGVIWVAAAAAIVMVSALILPLGLDLLSGLPLAVPIFGDHALWTKATTQFAALTGMSPRAPLQLSVIIATGLGLATLAPLFGAAVASRDEGEAWRSGLVGMVWLALGALLITTTLAGATLALETTVGNRVATALPHSILAASARGDITICGIHTSDPIVLDFACDAKAENGQLRPAWQDMRTDASYLLQSLPRLRGSEPTLARLAAAFMIVLGTGLAAAGLQTLITALGHDILHPKRRKFGPVSRRLAFTRALAIGFVILASYWLAGRAGDVRTLFGLALMLSAALVAPILTLALIPGTTSVSAFTALCVAAFVTVHFLIFDAAVMPPHELATDAIFAAFDGLAVGLFVTLLPKVFLPDGFASKQKAAGADAPQRPSGRVPD